MKRQESNAIDRLLDEKINELKYSFLDSSRSLFVDDVGGLVHPGEFGVYREQIVKKFLYNILPERMGVESGFVVVSDGKISTQCDIVIYDKSNTPLIKNQHGQRFFPAESVVAIGEIKSKLSVNKLKSALRKLATTKYLRDFLNEPSYLYCRKKDGLQSKYQPEINQMDQIFSFLICEKFSFNFEDELKGIVGCYSEINPQWPFCHRHNMVLSITDGLLTYVDPDGMACPFPAMAVPVSDSNLKNIETRLTPKLMNHRFIVPQIDSIEHIRHFTSMLHTAISSISVLFPDMAKYIRDRDDVAFFDLEHKAR